MGAAARVVGPLGQQPRALWSHIAAPGRHRPL